MLEPLGAMPSKYDVICECTVRMDVWTFTFFFFFFFRVRSEGFSFLSGGLRAGLCSFRFWKWDRSRSFTRVHALSRSRGVRCAVPLGLACIRVVWGEFCVARGVLGLSSVMSCHVLSRRVLSCRVASHRLVSCRVASSHVVHKSRWQESLT